MKKHMNSMRNKEIKRERAEPSYPQRAKRSFRCMITIERTTHQKFSSSMESCQITIDLSATVSDDADEIKEMRNGPSKSRLFSIWVAHSAARVTVVLCFWCTCDCSREISLPPEHSFRGHLKKRHTLLSNIAEMLH